MKEEKLRQLQKKVLERSYELAKETLPKLRRNEKPATPLNYMKYYEQCETKEDSKERHFYESMIEEEVLRKETIEKMLTAHFFAIFKGKYDDALQKLLQQIKRTRTTEELFEKTASILKALIDVSNTQKLLNNVSESTNSLKKFTQDINIDMGKLTADILGGISENRIEKAFGDNIGGKINKTIEKSKRIEAEHIQKEQELMKVLALQKEAFEQSIEELQEKLKQTEKIVYTDALTGIANRRALDERLQEELSTSLRENKPCAVALLDIDHFKKINDTYGHQIGDQALRHLAKVVTSSIKHSDFLARYGGEEFAVIFPGTKYFNALAAAENIRKHVEENDVTVRGTPLRITISLGVSEVQNHRVESVKDLVEFADKALYDAKKTGRNKVC